MIEMGYKQMVCVCDNCHYTFEIVAKAERCPDCGKVTIRSATDKEEREYYECQNEMLSW